MNAQDKINAARAGGLSRLEIKAIRKEHDRVAFAKSSAARIFPQSSQSPSEDGGEHDPQA